MKALNDNAHPLESLLQQHCPNGVEFKELGELCEINGGKLNANKANLKAYMNFLPMITIILNLWIIMLGILKL